MLLRLGEIKQKYKVSHNSLIEWENRGLLTSHKTPGGHRRFLQSDVEKLLSIDSTKTHEKKVAIYCRCSTAKQKENLERQVERLRKHCADAGYINVQEFSEIASGLNDKRRQLHKLIEAVLRGQVNHIIVEYKDRLTRFGIKFILHFLEGLGCTVEFLGQQATKDENTELVEDLLSLITTFSARLYGARGGRKKQAKQQIKEEMGLIVQGT
jgi:putative resolvase